LPTVKDEKLLKEGYVYRGSKTPMALVTPDRVELDMTPMQYWVTMYSSRYMTIGPDFKIGIKPGDIGNFIYCNRWLPKHAKVRERRLVFWYRDEEIDSKVVLAEAWIWVVSKKRGKLLDKKEKETDVNLTEKRRS